MPPTEPQPSGSKLQPRLVWIEAIGVADDVLAHLDKVSLAFQRPVLLWLGLILLIPVGYPAPDATVPDDCPKSPMARSNHRSP